ncbi:MAG: hypothetical protein HY671_02010 [Chloroflexi bacterium]|nr:hypothetical protein [Chloroflexota bacterium]
MTIYVECKTDATLVNALLGTAKTIAHEKGKPGVCRRLQGGKNSMAMVDEDPGEAQPTYIGKLRVKRNLSEHGLKLLQDRSTGNQVVVLRPKLEDWILSACSESGLKASSYGLPQDPSRLHRAINISQSDFRRLVRDLKKRKSERLSSLGTLLRGQG